MLKLQVFTNNCTYEVIELHIPEKHPNIHKRKKSEQTISSVTTFPFNKEYINLKK
jgi:hypothetical protein